MILDIIILLTIVLFAIYGYSRGLIRGLSSLVSPVLGVWLALRKCGSLAALLDPFINDHTASLVIGFVIIFLTLWLGLRLARNLLVKLVDWPRCGDFDQFLGGLFGLARGIAVVGVLLAIGLSAFPFSVRLIETSQASLRLLSLGERISGGFNRDRATPTGHAARNNDPDCDHQDYAFEASVLAGSNRH